MPFPDIPFFSRRGSGKLWPPAARSSSLRSALLVEYLAHVAVQVPHERRNHIVTAAELSPEVQEVATTTSDGVAVAAWWWPVAHEEGAPVILVHGLGGSRADMWRAINLAHGLGRSTLAIDLRGHGRSAPSLTSFGWRERLDVEAWIDWLQAKEGPGMRPVLWGTSMGAVACLLAAAEDPRASGVIADAPFDTLRHTLVRHAALLYHLPDSPLISLVAWRIGAENDLPIDQVDCLQAVQKIHVPTLFIAGELDDRMPPAVVRSIYDAAPEPKAWFIVAQAGHSWRPFHDDFCHEVCAYMDQSARDLSHDSPDSLVEDLAITPNKAAGGPVLMMQADNPALYGAAWRLSHFVGPALVNQGKAAFPALLGHLDDHSQSIPFGNYLPNDVGGACYFLLTRELYGLPETYEETATIMRRGKDGHSHERPVWGRGYFDQLDLKKWLAQRDKLSLAEIQLEPLAWVVSEEEAIGAATPDDETEILAPLRSQLAKLKKLAASQSH